MQPVPNYDYYSEWDKFNVDEELERLDAEEKKSAQKVVSPRFNCMGAQRAPIVEFNK